MKIGPKQLAAVVALPGDARYRHFIKIVADQEHAWGLYDDGWALAAADDGVQVFPLWPAREYAEICAEKEWSGYEPVSLGLDELFSDLLPKLEQDGMLPGVFFTPAEKGVTPTIEQLKHDLRIELQRY